MACRLGSPSRGKVVFVKTILVVVFVTLLCFAPPSRGAATLPTLHWTFDGGPDGWRVIFGPGQTRITVTREHVKVGAGALESMYEITPRTYFAVAREVSLPEQPSVMLSFWIKSQHATHLGVFLTERDDSGYGHRLELPVGQWKRVALNSKQFLLDTSNAGNKDENGRLDVGQIGWITIVDFAGLFSREKAKGSFYLDDFRLGP